MQLRRWHSLIIFGVILALWMVQTKTIHQSWNESSRLATIEALVEHGTWRIDASPYAHQTGDKMLLDGHYYSEKPPLFAAIL
jgi:protein-S-isoprenylcysteine O-methyltransferase Ste14